jgi:hypothetical protein
MSNKEYVRELCAGYSELWALDQLADELDKRDKRIAELEAGLAESCRDMRDEFLGQCPIAGELQARLDAVAKLPEKWKWERYGGKNTCADELQQALEQDDDKN